MFGGRVARLLAQQGAQVGGMTRSDKRGKDLERDGIVPVVAQMSELDSLRGALNGVKRIFLVTPMVPGLGQMEQNVIQVAEELGVQHIVKLYGCVEHEGDALDAMHQESISRLKESSISWTLVSPNTIMESNLFTQAESIKSEGAIYTSAGSGKMGMISADDVARVAAHVLTSEGHGSQNYQLTGPEAVSFEDVAQAFSEVLQKPVEHRDIPEAEMLKLLVEYGGMTPEAADLEVLCHFRLFKAGAATKVTDTFSNLMGEPPMSVKQFIEGHRSHFSR
jgi:uncharacterized protein YbjT (DUF2867 family)